nr:1-acyl-sn-glycerol-3-phosphate acyltransferase [Nitratireductor sp.]
SLLVYPGKIVMEFLPPIEPGLPREEFAGELIERIETATARLVAEAANSPDAPPTAKDLKTGRLPAG